MILFKRYSRRADVRVRHIMSKPVVTAAPDTTLEEAARTMVENGVGSLVIVDEEGRVAGIVTERDLLYSLARKLPCATKVSDVMSRNVVTARPEDPVLSVVDKMRDMNIRHVPVVDEEGRPIGMVSVRDIIDVGMMFFRVFYQEE